VSRTIVRVACMALVALVLTSRPAARLAAQSTSVGPQEYCLGSRSVCGWNELGESNSRALLWVMKGTSAVSAYAAPSSNFAVGKSAVAQTLDSGHAAGPQVAFGGLCLPLSSD
jgi:hypothetical protein